MATKVVILKSLQYVPLECEENWGDEAIDVLEVHWMIYDEDWGLVNLFAKNRKARRRTLRARSPTQGFKPRRRYPILVRRYVPNLSCLSLLSS